MSLNIDRRRSMLEELLEGQPATKKHKTTHTGPIGTVLLDAQRALDEKRFGSAIELLTQVVKSWTDQRGDLIHIYDLRSTAYVKSSQLNLALQDAKEMIKRDKSDVRGYLKCAHVEQLRGRLSDAMRICEYGLQKIPPSDRGHKKLEICLIRLGQQARRKVVYEKGTDPITVLPTELIDLVLSFFDYKELVAILRVSRKWRDVVRSMDVLSRTLDFRRSRKTLTREEVKAAFTRLGKTPKIIALARMSENACQYAVQELSHWIQWESLESLIVEEAKINLKRIRFERFKSLRVFQLGEQSTLDQDFAKVLQDCPHLEFGSFLGNFPYDGGFATFPPRVGHRLRSLSYCGRSQTLVFPTRCLFPELERLEFHHTQLDTGLNLTEYTNLRQLSLRKVHIRYNLRTAPGLQCFELDGPFANVFPQPEEIKMPAGDLETITSTGSETIRFLTYAIRQGLSHTKFRHLSISDFVFFSHIAGRPVRSDLALLSGMNDCRALSGVESLVIKDDHIIDPDFVLIHTLFPSIRSLEIQSERITNAFVSDLVRITNGNLKSVTLRNCPNVRNDILKWATTVNVDVSIVRQKQKADTTAGRAIRYE